MYDKRAKQDALDLWFSMPGEMSVDDFAAELGYPSGSTLRNWIKADPRHDPDKCQYRSKPVLPKLEAIRRVAEGATAAQAARETGLTPQQVRYSVGRYARGGTAALLPAPARKRRKGEAVDEGKTRRASRPARPMPCEQPPGLPEELPDDPAALKAIIADLELSNAALREVLAVLKAGAPALTNAEAAGCASRLEGAFGAAAACAALGLARSTYYYQLLPPMYFPPFTPMIHNRSRQPAPAGYANVFPPLSAPPPNLSRNARASRARALSEPG